MENLRILNKKENERILNIIKENYDIKDIDFDCAMLINKEGKIFLISNDIHKIDLNKLRVNELGLYIARLDKELRLTIEGSQIFGKYANKNILEINEDQANKWMTGEEINCHKEFDSFVIIKYKDNYLGTGKYKEGRIINYIPKERWIKINSLDQDTNVN
jgi:NOL1/NOP2/fmu family ribosome biogenesis protein